MYILEPMFHRTLWGGNRLKEVYGSLAEGLGHLYAVRCKDRHANIILNGAHKGKSLFDVIGAYPLSVALVDARMDLSIQVHPGGTLAKRESYYFLDAPTSGHMYCGVKNLDKGRVETGDVLPYVNKIPIKKGDYCHVPPCAVHALSAGSFVYEIEAGADNTYRLFDYDRVDADGNRRPLQTEQALAVLNPVLTAETRPFLPNTVIREETYATQLLSDITLYTNDTNVPVCLTLLSGNTVIENTPIKTGMSLIIEPNERLEGVAIERAMAAWPLS